MSSSGFKLEASGIAMLNKDHSARDAFLRIPELLALVFELTLPSEGYPTPYPYESPLLLTRINSHWRSIALRTPKLWAALCLRSQMLTKGIEQQEMVTPVDRHVAVLDLWLKRSGTFPVSFDFFYFRDADCMAQLLDRIIPHASRWRALTLSAHLTHLQKVLDCVRAGTPLLERFTARPLDAFEYTELYKLTRNVPGNLPPVVLDVSLAPQLVSFTVEGSISFGFHPLAGLAWSGVSVSLRELRLYYMCLLPLQTPLTEMRTLRELTLHDVSSNGLFPNFPSLFPLLELLDLEEWTDSQQARFHSPRVATFPRLHTLKLASCTGCMTSFLSQLTLPALSRLELYGGFQDETPWPHIPPLLRRSQCPLKELVTENYSILEADMLAFLGEADALEDLIVADTHLTNAVIASLILDLPGSSNNRFGQPGSSQVIPPASLLLGYCSRLVSIRLPRTHVFDSMDVLGRMLRSRTGKDGLLQHCILPYHLVEVLAADPHPAILQCIQDGTVVFGA